MKAKKTLPAEPADRLRAAEDNWKRALADYQNLLKRVEAEKKEFGRLANLGLITSLLPCLDTLEMAAAASQDPGVQMAAKQFRAALTSEGLEEISPGPGEPFDHLRHECSETVFGGADSTIASLVLMGYKIGDYVIRPARVRVYKE